MNTKNKETRMVMTKHIYQNIQNNNKILINVQMLNNVINL